jgi:glycosyltransferase involved in cell wall biosynthesis
MASKLKTFWLNLGFLDRDMDLSERRQILRALAEQKVEVRANFNYIKTPLSVQGLDKVWMLKLHGKTFLGIILLYAKQQLTLMKNLDVDVVVVRAFNLHQTLPLWFFWRKVLHRRRPKFVLDLRTLPVDVDEKLWGKLRKIRFDTSVRLAFRHFEGLSVITEKMKIDLQTEVSDFKKKVCVWSSSVDPNLFDPRRVADVRDELGFNDRFVIMYHGILSPNRGLQQAVEAIAIVRKSHPEIMFFLLGKGSAQPKLEEQIRDLGLESHVFIHPPVPYESVPKYINSVQTGILPFPDLDWWNTSSPIKLYEYLAMGKPVIVTDIAAHRAVLGKIKCGFFVPNHEPVSIAHGINTAIENAFEITELGRIARTMVIKHFTWERQARKIKDYFQDLLNNDPLHPS